MKNNEQGFGAVEGLLIVVIIVLLGVVGMMVLNNSNKPAVSGRQTTINDSAPVKPDPYADWQQYCSASGAACIKYPKDWKTATTQTADPNISGITITSPSGKTEVMYSPFVSGLGGVCEPNNCFFKTDSIAKPDGVNPGKLQVVKGVYTKKDSSLILADYYISSDDQIAKYKLAVNQNVDVGFFVSAFTNPAQGSKDIELLQVKNISGTGFDSIASAENWFTTTDVVTAGKIISSVTVK